MKRFSIIWPTLFLIGCGVSETPPESTSPATPIVPVALDSVPASVGPVLGSAASWDGSTFKIQLGIVGTPTAASKGFNDPEASWQLASASPAEIRLPYIVTGPIRVTVNGWMRPEIAAQSPVTFRFGSSEATVTFTGENAAHVFEADVGQEGVDLIIVESTISGPTANDSRKIGVGIASIEVSKR